MNKNWNGDKWLKFKIANYFIIFLTYSVQGFRGFIWRQRRKQYFRMPIRVFCTDIILHIFCFTSHRVIEMAIHYLMKLQDISSRNCNSIKTFMDDPQDITVTGNFLFISVLWSGFFLYQLFEASVSGNNAFNFIGSFRTLNFCYVHQFFQFLRALLEIELLFTGFFINSSNISKDIRVPCSIFYG